MVETLVSYSVRVSGESEESSMTGAGVVVAAAEVVVGTTTGVTSSATAILNWLEYWKVFGSESSWILMPYTANGATAGTAHSNFPAEDWTPAGGVLVHVILPSLCVDAYKQWSHQAAV